MKFLKYLTPALKKLDHEMAQKAALYAMKGFALKRPKAPDYPTLSQTIWGHNFLSPLGLAAGFDKNAIAINGHFHLGFGFVEIGTVTPEPQDGNDKPRIFMDEKNGAVINRMGFPNDGLELFGRRVGSFRLAHENHWGILGINLGVNANSTDAAEDLKTGMAHVGGMADYITLNLSSPNTKGLRAHLQPKNMEPILASVMEEREKIPERLPAVLVKISPDMDQTEIPDLCKVMKAHEVNGVIVSNTTVQRPSYLNSEFSSHPGGLSGKPLTDMSTDLISKFYNELKGSMTIIGCGGIYNAATAYDKIKAGANLLQLYSGLVTEGPQIVEEIQQELVSLIAKDGYNNISEAVGASHK